MSMKKLQTEIDRVLKKVNEGVETFESILEKINSSTIPHQKEKHENDLKKEIKKLQRLRDQIKTWISLNEIKDKRSLIENRKLIETQMERFKGIEKEMKTKAFSKEGLMQKEKHDPKDKKKSDLIVWLSEMVQALQTQNDKDGYDIEVQESRTRNKNRKQIEALKELQKRDKKHMAKLELILRLLESNSLDQEKVDMIIDLKEDIGYYVENNREADFEEDEEMYDELDLKEEERRLAICIDVEDEIDNESDEDQPPTKSSSRATTSPVASTYNRPDTSSDQNPVSTSTSTKATISSPKSALVSTTPETSTIAAPASATPVAATVPSTSTPTTNSNTEVTVPQPPTGLKYAQAAAAAAAAESAKNESAWVEPLRIVDQPKRPNPQPMSSVGSQSLLSSQYSEKSMSSELTPPPPPPQEISAARLPRSLTDLGENYEKAKARASRLDMNYTRAMLDTSMKCFPDLNDSERPYMYQPRHPTANPTPGYPTEPLPSLMNPATIEKFGKSEETQDLLFFMFYYQQGTYQQYLAAKQLKNNSWRFHTEKQRWFQRSEEPKEITDDYEQGKYEYFDCGEAWRKGTKSEFRFEYKFLEEA